MSSEHLFKLGKKSNFDPEIIYFKHVLHIYIYFVILGITGTVNGPHDTRTGGYVEQDRR